MEADWTVLEDGLDANTVRRGATAGIARPPGGGDFLYAFNSVTAADGAVGLFTNKANFAPMAKGGSIRGCVQRGPGGGPLGFSPFLFIGLAGDSVNDVGYLLGLSDDDPHKIVLAKRAISAGIPASEGDGVLRASTGNFTLGTWLHLRLDMIVNVNGDVVLNAYQNDLAAHPLGGAPDWLAIPGLVQFIDDALGINSGSPPLTSGRAGFGFHTTDVTRRGYFDHVVLYRQV